MEGAERNRRRPDSLPDAIGRTEEECRPLVAGFTRCHPRQQFKTQSRTEVVAESHPKLQALLSELLRAWLITSEPRDQCKAEQDPAAAPMIVLRQCKGICLFKVRHCTVEVA